MSSAVFRHVVGTQWESQVLWGGMGHEGGRVVSPAVRSQ